MTSAEAMSPATTARRLTMTCALLLMVFLSTDLLPLSEAARGQCITPYTHAWMALWAAGTFSRRLSHIPLFPPRKFTASQ